MTPILGIPFKHSEQKSKSKELEVHYELLPQLIGSMNSKANEYFRKLFEGDDKSQVKAKIALELESWEKEIAEYSVSFNSTIRNYIYQRFI